MTVVQAALILFLIFFGLMFIGVPISVSIGCSSIVVLLLSGFETDVLAHVVAQRCFKGIDSFALLALPFFMLAGSIMNKGGIARRLVRLARFFCGKDSGLPGSDQRTDQYVFRGNFRFFGCSCFRSRQNYGPSGKGRRL